MIALHDLRATSVCGKTCSIATSFYCVLMDMYSVCVHVDFLYEYIVIINSRLVSPILSLYHSFSVPNKTCL